MMSTSRMSAWLTTEQLSSMTIAKLLIYGQHCLLANSDSAKLDVELLICFIIDKPRSYLLTWPEKKLSLVQSSSFAELLLRRINGEPIAYIINTREFWSLPLKVSPATLIPRPDTEVLVEMILARHPNKELSCLDLGTGTGAIALALASENSNWKIDAIDFSDDAVQLAMNNARDLNLTQVNIFQSNWFSSLKSDVNQYEVIVSNPPYLDENDQHLAQGDVKFEPKSALVAGDNGLADIKHIANEAPSYLKNEGYLYIEHGCEQKVSVQDILAVSGYEKIQSFKDYNGQDRITCGCFVHE